MLRLCVASAILNMNVSLRGTKQSPIETGGLLREERPRDDIYKIAGFAPCTLIYSAEPGFGESACIVDAYISLTIAKNSPTGLSTRIFLRSSLERVLNNRY
jgi:hypothetical protein